MKYFFILFLILTSAGNSVSAQSRPERLHFRTSSGHVIKVQGGAITYDNHKIWTIKYPEDIIFDSKSDRLIEDHGSVFLFIAMAGNPNNDRLNAFLITSKKATLLVDAILSPIRDYDGDGYPEFGGRDLTEVYPNPDSMYYIPTAYYEIKNGKIQPDTPLTRSEDIAINGRYLPPGKQLDKDGFCCKVIPVPGRKHKGNRKPELELIEKSYMGSDTISVFAASDILDKKADINYVKHDYDGKWTFYAIEPGNSELQLLKKVQLAALIKIDKSVLLLSWVEKGRFAKRTSKTAPWGFNGLPYK